MGVKKCKVWPQFSTQHVLFVVVVVVVVVAVVVVVFTAADAVTLHHSYLEWTKYTTIYGVQN